MRRGRGGRVRGREDFGLGNSRREVERVHWLTGFLFGRNLETCSEGSG